MLYHTQKFICSSTLGDNHDFTKDRVEGGEGGGGGGGGGGGRGERTMMQPCQCAHGVHILLYLYTHTQINPLYPVD